MQFDYSVEWQLSFCYSRVIDFFQIFFISEYYVDVFYEDWEKYRRLTIKCKESIFMLLFLKSITI